MESKPPKTYEEFVSRFPDLGKAWDLLHSGTKEAGPLDDRTLRLVKLGVAIGAQREGATHSAVRKALSQGISRQEIEQVVAASASTIGLPSAVAAFTWVRDVVEARRG
jgi:alkylhydroperoxidase/carboxymuconolactone decarboxylase family protein YurZ